MRFSKPAVEAPGPNIAPLLDVVLLLLIFFVVTSSFAEREIALELPEAGATERAAERALVVNVRADGRVVVDDEETTLEQLETRLARTAEEEGSLEIRADAATAHGDVVAVLDRARRAGVLSVGIATQAASADGTARASGTSGTGETGGGSGTAAGSADPIRE